MSILTPASFRAASVDEACVGFELTDDEANDARLTSAITRYTRWLYDRTGDQFESAADTQYYDVWFPSDSLLLTKRCTAITSVTTYDANGTGTVQPSSAYRLHTSLDSAGAVRVSTFDALDLVPLGSGLSGVSDPFSWPCGPRIVKVIGTFGWLTPPPEAKAALAELVWDHFKAKRGDLGRAQRMVAGGVDVTFVPDGEGSGLPNVDAFVTEFRYTYLRGLLP